MAASPALPFSPIAADVLRGLTSTPKRLPPRLLYDDSGSALFERITRLPEYYLTRTERAIFEQHGADIIRAAAGREPLTIVELGAGSAEKTGILIGQALQQRKLVSYEPVDVSQAALTAAASQLARRWPRLPVVPIAADYTNGFRLSPNGHHRRMVLWIGSSMGNFEHAEAVRILRNVRRFLKAGDGLLLGADLAPSNSKPPHMVLAAYDDNAGITAQFNLNLLARINRELGGEFDLNGFCHVAEWNPNASRMEMYLESLHPQQVRIASLGLRLAFAAGERIHTENSYKYAPAQLTNLLSAAGFTFARTWSDAQHWFAVILANVV
jgi:dimethylhistidine N-methyltransferase